MDHRITRSPFRITRSPFRITRSSLGPLLSPDRQIREDGEDTSVPTKQVAHSLKKELLLGVALASGKPTTTVLTAEQKVEKLQRLQRYADSVNDNAQIALHVFLDNYRQKEEEQRHRSESTAEINQTVVNTGNTVLQKVGQDGRKTREKKQSAYDIYSQPAERMD